MKALIFILLVIFGVLFLPDGFIISFVERFIPVNDDGEYGMNNFEMTVLLVKALLCAVGAGTAIFVLNRRYISPRLNLMFAA